MFPNPQYRMPGSNPNPLGTRAMAGPTVGVVIGVQRHIELYTSKIPSLARSSTGMEVVKLFSMMSVLTQRHNYARGVGVGVGGYTFSTVHTLHSQKPLAIQNHSPPPPHFLPHFHSSSLSFFFLSSPPPPPPSLFTKQILDWPCDYKDNKIVSTTYTKTTDFKKLKTKTKQQFNVHFCLRSQEQTYTPVYASTHIVIFTWSSPDLHLSHATHMHAHFFFSFFLLTFLSGLKCFLLLLLFLFILFIFIFGSFCSCFHFFYHFYYTSLPERERRFDWLTDRLIEL